MKRAFVVMGVPSSGTRLLTRILIAAGCVGDGDYAQRYDEVPPTADLIVIRRHQPTGRPPKWARNTNIIRALQRLGYAVSVLIITRDWGCTMQSQIAAPHAADITAAHILTMGAWRAMLRRMPDDVPFEVVTYESIVQRPQAAIAALYARHGLTQIEPIEPLRDGNAKYYAG